MLKCKLAVFFDLKKCNSDAIPDARLEMANPNSKMRPDAHIACTMKFICPQRWDGLTKTDKPTIRHCPVCAKDVHYCATSFEVTKAIQANRCIAFHSGTTKDVERNSALLGVPLSVSKLPVQPRKSIWQKLISWLGR